MTCRGHVKNGVVVLDDPVSIPEGMSVEITVVNPETNAGSDDEFADLRRDLLDFAGKFSGLPEDASQNIDHYLYGHPRQ